MLWCSIQREVVFYFIYLIIEVKDMNIKYLSW